MRLESIDISNYPVLPFFVIREGDAPRRAQTHPTALELCHDMLAAPAAEVSVFAVLEFSCGIAQVWSAGGGAQEEGERTLKELDACRPQNSGHAKAAASEYS
jgi:hypothetical protein